MKSGKYLPKIIAVIHFLLSLITDHFIFDFNSLNWFSYVCCKILFLGILFFGWSAIFKYFSKKKNNISKKQIQPRAIVYFLALVIPLLLILLPLLWPGTWLGDDLKFLTENALTCNFHWRLNYLTTLYYIFGYMLFPTTSAPVILNILISGGVFAYIVSRLRQRFKTRWVWLAIIPFLLPHTLFYLFYPNRPVVFGLVFILLFSILLFDYLAKIKLSKEKFITILCMTAFLANIRSEAIYLIIVVPLLVIFAYHVKFSFKKALKYFGLLLIPFLLLAAPQKIHDAFENTPSGYRNLPSYLSPLSVMLVQDDFHASDEDLASIDKVLSVEDMKKYSTPADVPCMWVSETCIRDYSDADYQNFKKAFINIISQNKKLFLKAKFATFEIATSINGDPFTTYEYNDSVIRQQIYKILEGKTGNNLYDALFRAVCNLYIPIIALTIIAIYLIIRKKYFLAAFPFIVLISAIPIFFTAPAAYFMYYFYVYLSGWMAIMYIIISLIKKYQKTIKKHKDYIIAGICSLVLSAIWYARIAHTLTDIFHYTDEQRPQFYLYCLCGYLILSSLLFAIYYFFKNRKKHKAFIKYFLIYFGIMMVFLILAWPGIFKGDEFYTIPSVTKMKFEYGQHYFTSIFYALSLSIVPTLAGITFFQIVIISAIVAYILAGVERLLKHSRLAYLLLIPLLLPPVIDNNLFTLRSSINAFLFLLVIFQLIFYAKDHRHSRLISLGIACCLLGNWKSEFIYVPILVVIYLLLFQRHNFNLRKFAIWGGVFLISFTLLRIPQSALKNYKLTLIANPMSSMALICDNLETSLSQEDVAYLASIISPEDLRKYASYYNVDALFHFKPGLTEEDETRLTKIFLKLAIKNPTCFIDARSLTYAATNYPTDDDRPNHTGAEAVSDQWTLDLAGNTYLKDNFAYTENPFGEDFKRWFVTTLLMRNYDDYKPNDFNHIFYNVTPPVIIGTVLMIYFAIRRRWQDASIFFIELAQFPIIFVSAPANFWMYYVGLYILLCTTICYYGIIKIDERA